MNHVALGITGQAVRVQRQELAVKVAAGAAKLAQGDLELLGLRHRVSLQQVVDGAIGGEERQPVGQFKALVAERPVGAQGRAAQGGFMNQMQGHAGGQSVRVQIARPSAQQVPRAQTKVLWNEQPQAQIASRNLIGQQLADFPLQACGIGGLEALHFAGALRRQQQGRVSGIEGVEFFFAGRIRR